MTFMVPSTSVQVRAGIQGLALPGAVAGSPILADDVAAIVASTAFENALDKEEIEDEEEEEEELEEEEDEVLS